ncbi:MAG TPA: M20/M25/M40 family metallo-hydrolase [Steroidobacteraceae bacterium]|nr:M20/M25/M40 family metallo-hydrolase [Steroidobacteraceae bacterium]
MKDRACSISIGVILAAFCIPTAWSAAQSEQVTRKMARDIFKQLIEINTTDSSGSTTVAARAMEQRLLDAGFPAADMTVEGPNERKGNMVARYRGKPGSKLRPVLIIGHLDVVEARREDWTTDPFEFVEQDGYFYGRGTQDMKASDAILVTDFIRMKHEGYVPDRDIILALTADEEGGKSNGVDWLLKNHRDLIDAEFALNPDAGAGGVVTDHGKPLTIEVAATEKLYGDYQLSATNPGGHSSLPTPDNAIYHVADALVVLEKSPFPFELNNVTREYFTQMAAIEKGQRAADLRAILAVPPDKAAIDRLGQDARYNSTMRTTCVATMMSAGHAPNALPQRAEANVNCRILPGHSQEEVRLALVNLFNDPKLTVRYRSDTGEVSDHASDRKAMPPPPLRPDVMESLRSVARKLWPEAPIIPMMMTVASDSVHTMMAGIPSYGICGVAIDRDDVRMHGKDERVPVESYYTGVEFYYEFLKKLTTFKK